MLFSVENFLKARIAFLLLIAFGLSPYQYCPLLSMWSIYRPVESLSTKYKFVLLSQRICRIGVAGLYVLSRILVFECRSNSRLQCQIFHGKVHTPTYNCLPLNKHILHIEHALYQSSLLSSTKLDK